MSPRERERESPISFLGANVWRFAGFIWLLRISYAEEDEGGRGGSRGGARLLLAEEEEAARGVFLPFLRSAVAVVVQLELARGHREGHFSLRGERERERKIMNVFGAREKLFQDRRFASRKSFLLISITNSFLPASSRMKLTRRIVFWRPEKKQRTFGRNSSFRFMANSNCLQSGLSSGASQAWQA